MDRLIPVVNKLQEIFSQVNMPFDLKLPQIVVVGAQSTGKSSVLESIVGKDFLPRGSGIVTRTPIILQLNRIASADLEDKKDAHAREYAIFGHNPKEVYEDFAAVRQEIENQTLRIAGENKGVSKEPILLKIFSPYVLNLTLVDLPGLTKVPVGSQPQDIDKIIRELVVSYIQNPNSIILAVSAANIDIANSDSLHLAREIDPKGDRTIGVVTKLDLMDRGTDALGVLKGKEYPLKLGYVGVVCRSQEDIRSNKSMRDAVKSEKEFFERSPSYSAIKDICGVEYLSKRLNRLLVQHIGECLPVLKKNVDLQLQSRRDELKAYGEGFSEEGSREGFHGFLLLLLSKYSDYYQATIEGTAKVNQTAEYKAGARISTVFQELYVKPLNYLTPFDNLTDEDIRTAILNAKALKPSLFIPEAAFESLIKLQIGRLMEPSLHCALQVHNELRNAAIHPDVPELQRFDRLQSKISEIITDLLRNYLEPTEKMIRNLIDIETAYINVNHPDVLTGTTAILNMIQNYDRPAMGESKEESKEIKPGKKDKDKEKKQAKVVATDAAPHVQLEVLGDGGDSVSSNGSLGGRRGAAGYEGPILSSLPDVIRAEGEPTPREELEVQVIKKLMVSYFRVVVVRVADVVPKIVMSFLVEKSVNTIHDVLVQKIIMEKDWEKLMEENPMIAEKRGTCKKIIKVLTDSQQALNEIRNFEF